MTASASLLLVTGLGLWSTVWFELGIPETPFLGCSNWFTVLRVKAYFVVSHRAYNSRTGMLKQSIGLALK